VLGLGGLAGHVHRGRLVQHFSPLGPLSIANYSAVSGACLMISRAVFERSNRFDEGLSSELAAIDLCLRIGESGLRTVYTPFATLTHHAPLPWESVRSVIGGEGEFLQRWTHALESDRYYSKNLPRTVEDGAFWQRLFYDRHGK
jgi:hypothetical protein